LPPINISILVIGLLAIFAIYFVLTRTAFGYSARAVGSNLIAARYAGIKDPKVILMTMLLGGACAGIAGGIIVMNISTILEIGISNNYGYVGIAVATLASLNPLGSVLTSVFFSFLYIGSESASVTGVPLSLANTITGLVVIFILFRSQIAQIASKVQQYIMPPELTKEVNA
jgi:general nucleoside transport system permease protein